MFSNSSRLRCRLRNAAARFLTRRASRLLRPVTSGGTKSFVLIVEPRGFFAAEGARLEARFEGTRLVLLTLSLRTGGKGSSGAAGEDIGSGDGA